MSTHIPCDFKIRDLKAALERARRLPHRIVVNQSQFDRTTVIEAVEVLKAIDRELYQPEEINDGR